MKVDTPTGQGHAEAGEKHDEGGWFNGHEDGWSSDGEASEESPMKWTPDDHGSSNDDDHQPPFYTEDNANNKNKMVDDTLDNEAPDR